MNGPEFDALLVAGFRRWGFAVVGQRGEAGPVDLLLRRGRESFVVCCKAILAKKVGLEPVRELHEAMTAVGAAGGYVLTAGLFTDDAGAFARERNIMLLDGPRLSEMLRKARDEVSYLGPNCPQCGRRMVKRLAKQGTYAGRPIWGCPRFPECRALVPVEEDDAGASVEDGQGEARAIEALRAKFRDGVTLKKLASLPFPVFEFDPQGWLLFCVEPEPGNPGANEYVAVHPSSGKVRFLGTRRR